MSAQGHAVDALSLVIYARDCKVLADFYARLLSLSPVEEAEDFTRLSSGRLEVVVVQTPPDIRERIVIESPPELRSETPLKPSFGVADAEALRSIVEVAGGGLKPAGAAWWAGGALHLDGWDPEGNIFQLRQPGA